MIKRVNIYPTKPIRSVNPVIFGVVRNITKSDKEIRACIIERAAVEEILPDNTIVKLDLSNYNTDNSIVKEEVVETPVVEVAAVIVEAPVEETIIEDTVLVTEAEAPVEDAKEEEITEEAPVVEVAAAVEEAPVEEPDVEEIVEEPTDEEVVEETPAPVAEAPVAKNYNNNQNKNYNNKK